MPTFVEEWVDLSKQDSMFPSWMRNRGLNEFEIEYCPWWLDYPLGQFPINEEERFKGNSHMQYYALEYAYKDNKNIL